ncbi:MAG: glycosyltransferase family 4 protein [Isosphaeraceae bacterium]
MTTHDSRSLGSLAEEIEPNQDDPPARLGLRVCVVGSFTKGGLPTQGELLAERLAKRCRRVGVISRSRNPLLRLVQVAVHLLVLGPTYDVFCVQVYGRRALALEAVAILLGRLWRRHVVLYFHAGSLPERLSQRPWPAVGLYRLADRLAGPSEYMRAGLAPLGLDLRVIPNALDVAPYHFDSEKPPGPRLLWLRTFHPLYNPTLALRAFERIRRRVPGASLTMAGTDRGSAAEVRRLAKAEDLTVRFEGQISKSEVPALMAEHDVYLNTPQVDNMPVTVVEAMLSGLAVVSTRVGGIPHLVVDEGEALLVPDDDPEAMADAVVRILEEPDLWRRLRLAGREKAESFSFEKILPLWMEFLTPENGPTPLDPNP